MSDLWINTDAGGLLRADWIKRVSVEQNDLMVSTTSHVGLGGSNGQWELGSDEYTVCRVGELHGGDRDHPDRRLVRLLAQARAQGASGIVEVHDDGRLGITHFDQ